MARLVEFAELGGEGKICRADLGLSVVPVLPEEWFEECDSSDIVLAAKLGELISQSQTDLYVSQYEWVHLRHREYSKAVDAPVCDEKVKLRVKRTGSDLEATRIRRARIQPLSFMELVQRATVAELKNDVVMFRAITIEAERRGLSRKFRSMWLYHRHGIHRLRDRQPFNI